MPFQVNVRALNKALDNHPELWGQHGWRKADSSKVHSEMMDIWVRYNDISKFKEFDSRFNDEHVPIWYDAWTRCPDVKQALKPIIFGLMAHVQGEMLGGVLITRIPPGGRIAPHEDHGWHVGYYDKFYISLQSAPGAVFHCGDEAINPATGDCWRFDNRREHWVVNDSDQARVTLIVCIRTEKYANERAVFETLG